MTSLKDLALERDTGSLYILVETCLARKYLELFEAPYLKNLIFPQTLALELKDSSSHAYGRLRKITSDARRNSFVFSNESFKDTHTTRKNGQSVQERNIEALLQMASWLVKNPFSRGLQFVVLSDNPMVKEKNADFGLGLTTFNLSEFLQIYHKDNKPLLDLFGSLKLVLDAAENENNPETSTTGFSEYKPLPDLENGVRTGQYWKGKLHVSKWRHHEASVKLGEKSAVKSIFIPDGVSRNRAIHGDIVAVEIVGKAEEGEEPRGRIVGIFQTNRRPYVCSLQVDDEGQTNNGSFVIVVPWDVRFPKIRMRTRQAEELKKKRIVVRVDEWPVSSNYPSGHYVSALGNIGDRDTELAVLMVEHEITTAPFTPKMLVDLPIDTPEHPWKPKPEELVGRRDISDWRIFSIDPLGSQDIDDALSACKLPNGNIQIGVHIADVTQFLPIGSLLDVEARSRATSVYLADRKIDMLPTILSETVCSLRAGALRHAVSVIWEINPRLGTVLDTWYGRTLIKSCYELNYDQAQRIIDGSDEEKKKLGDSEYDSVRADLLLLRKVYQKLYEKRIAAGALELESFEIKFKFNDAKNPIGVINKKQIEVMKIVSEFMIFANVAVAKKIHSAFPDASLLRRHPFPIMDAFEDVVRCAMIQGVKINTSSNLTLAQSLEKIQSKDPYVKPLIKSLTSLALAEAEYFSTGCFDLADFYHYGLAAQFYTHFTSPIRRYADVIVHRQLLESLKETPKNYYGKDELQEISEYINKCNRASKNVQRSCNDLFHVFFFQGQEITADAIVYNFKKDDGIFIFVPKYGLKTTIWLRDREGDLVLPPNAFSLNPNEYKSEIKVIDFEVHPSRTKIIFKTNYGPAELRLFNHITVKIHVVDSRSHMPQLKIDLLHFGTNDHETSEKVLEIENASGVVDSEQTIDEQLFKEYKNSDTTKGMYHLTEKFKALPLSCNPLDLPVEEKKKASTPSSTTENKEKTSKEKTTKEKYSRPQPPRAVFKPPTKSFSGRRIFKEVEYNKAFEVEYDLDAEYHAVGQQKEVNERYGSQIADAEQRFRAQNFQKLAEKKKSFFNKKPK
eukprot:TRINITY_DN9317_c0_g1_i1.p1 TRINITY_DN9317_c0_g1~~TRINITY_DN9317_c0_g1_i1.p1  ORF type:complete len:1117 (-),score=227.07 TRINITY_DN9317_c0_g1_i1:39-3254(-)